VFCVPQDDDWRLNDLSPVDVFNKDVQILNDSELLVAFVKLNPPSAGVQFELGMAHAKKKPIILIHQVDDVLPDMYIGLVEADFVTEIIYQNDYEVVPALQKALDNRK